MHTSTYTPTMPITSIKVSTETRDRLKAQAKASGRTIAEQIDELVFLADREARFAAMKQAIANTSPEEMALYREEAEWWEQLSNDSLAEYDPPYGT